LKRLLPDDQYARPLYSYNRCSLLSFPKNCTSFHCLSDGSFHEAPCFSTDFSRDSKENFCSNTILQLGNKRNCLAPLVVEGGSPILSNVRYSGSSLEFRVRVGRVRWARSGTLMAICLPCECVLLRGVFYVEAQHAAALTWRLKRVKRSVLQMNHRRLPQWGRLSRRTR